MTCVVEWLNTLDRPVTWLSVDPADDDPGRFFAYLVAALQKVDPALGQQIAGASRAGQLPPGEMMATILSNDILASARPFLLVLDDLQVITRHRDETTELHRRASRWYANAGSAFAGEAIRHALAAADYAAAVDLLERHATGLIGQGYAKTVDGWVRAIPAEWDAQRPRTHLASAWMHLLRGTYAQAAPYLARLQATFAGSGLAPILMRKKMHPWRPSGWPCRPCC